MIDIKSADSARIESVLTEFDGVTEIHSDRAEDVHIDSYELSTVVVVVRREIRTGFHDDDSLRCCINVLGCGDDDTEGSQEEDGDHHDGHDLLVHDIELALGTCIICLVFQDCLFQVIL